MSDHESEVIPESLEGLDGLDGEPGLSGSYSGNGNDPGAIAVVTDGTADAWVDDGAMFLADLARAMRSTAAAEHTRDAEDTGRRRQAHLDAIRAREALEAEELREYAKEDVKGIDAWSDGEIKRVKLERERRIASRREQLQIRLEEHRTVVAREVEAVEAAIVSYNVEIEQFFGRLESETDPVEIARQAGDRPSFPILELIGPNDAPVAQTDTITPIAPMYYTTPIETPAAPEPIAAHDEHDHGADDGPTAASPMIGVMDPEAGAQPVEAPWESEAEVVTEPVTADSPIGETVEAQAGSGEPVAVAAEARVVMPRSSGAGSWLRWPNNSVDRSDSGR